MIQKTLIERMTEGGDRKAAEFGQKLKVSEREILGTRTPVLAALAKELAKKEGTRALDDFLLYPSVSYDEVVLMYKVFGLLKLDEVATKAYLQKLLPYNDSWATNDTLCTSFVACKKEPQAYWPLIIGYLESSNPWDIRFATITMMSWYLIDEYIKQVLSLLSTIENDHYYVIMGLGWAYATAFAKYRDLTLPYMEKGVLPEKVRKKAIQKCIESFRVSEEDKELLRSIRQEASRH
ncbi:DNA alkylation repair protein [uncultured Sphaerochaeta sp.]|uniref:DNA alkylation repair protein n=1 Tax=uncultured Sphaerochaeta sp. TaxID=886478 RepID=UPI002A0A8F0A|nr:DNA alkylation repair protein [uncultured Sphaerochaeta sp.]